MSNPVPITEVYDVLLAALGPQHWWPGDSAVEIMVGTVLVQHTAWINVEKALERLKQEQALSWEQLHQADEETVAQWIRPAGTYRVKARRLKALAALLCEQFDGDEEAMFNLGVDEARKKLLQVCGIGPETADSILLYAGEKPVFVIDAYTRRIFSRHGWAGEKDSYDILAGKFTTALPESASLYNDYHALLVQVGKTWCRRKPQCAQCPLHSFLPHEKPKN